MKMKSRWAAGSALLALSMGANAGFIDLFTTNQAVADVRNGEGTVGAGSTSFVTGAGIIPALGDVLGERDMQVDAILGAVDGGGDGNECDNVADQCARMAVVGSELRFSNDAGVTGQGTVQWDGSDASMTFDRTGLGGVDLTEGGTVDSFEFTILESDLNWVFTLEVATDATHWTKVEIEATPVSSGNPIQRTILFASLENSLLCGNPGATGDPQILSVTCGGANDQPVDFSNLGGMEIVLNTPAPEDIGDDCPNGGDVTDGCLPEGERQIAVDMRLASITTPVPEPSVFGLMGAGLLVLAAVTRRRKQKA